MGVVAWGAVCSGSDDGTRTMVAETKRPAPQALGLKTWCQTPAHGVDGREF
jgi:hypothetical protein